VKTEADLRLLVRRGMASPYYEVREVEEPEPTAIVQVAEDVDDDLDDDPEGIGLTRLEILDRLYSQQRPEVQEKIMRARRQAEAEGTGE
jgi:hypothetical protein